VASFVEPMLAQAMRFPEEGAPLRRGGWVYERKLDGLRFVAVRDGDRVELWSRNHLSWNRRFPALVRSLAAVPVTSFVLDGEVVAFAGERDSFQLLQGGAGGAPPVLVAFDLLHLLGRDTTGLPLSDRYDLLRRLFETGPMPPDLVLSAHLEGEPEELYATACGRGWEGLVAKKVDSAYRSGRSPDWRKIKCTARQELVIGGWTDPGGARTGFGALLVGWFDGDRLVYAGKVGTGFAEATLRELHSRLAALGTDHPPFADPPGERGAHWVEPVLVAEIAFTEWTRDGRLRHPAFLGLRDDKPARAVVRETPPEETPRRPPLPGWRVPDR
jgi:bifunctional non-homologous end joining protein LigD